jgi:hypothetical protein
MVTSRGGAGSGTGGGGGGGRISIVHRVSQSFTGDVFADGGALSVITPPPLPPPTQPPPLPYSVGRSIPPYATASLDCR